MQITANTHAFITGGASGIGLAIGDALAARGAAVTLTDIDAATLAEVAASRGPRVQGLALDTRDREGWARVKAAAEAAFGPVDLLVNNAGIAPSGELLTEMAPESFDRVISINLTGVFNGIHAFAADMAGRGRGHIVNTASIAGISTPTPGLGAYATAKAGVVMISQALHGELAAKGVGVSALCPGYVVTNIGANTRKLGGARPGPAAPPQLMPTGGMDPATLGPMVVTAIERDLPLIFTHDHRDAVAARNDAILAGFAETLA